MNDNFNQKKITTKSRLCDGRILLNSSSVGILLCKNS